MVLLDEMKTIHTKKNGAYSGVDNPDAFANFRMCESFGVSAFLGCLVRMSDKFIRITNIVKNKKNDTVPDENLKDTFMDLAVYSVIAVCLLEESENKKGILNGRS
jgi:hypothetical protein